MMERKRNERQGNGGRRGKSGRVRKRKAVELEEGEGGRAERR